MVQRATSRPTPRPGIEVVVLARRQLEAAESSATERAFRAERPATGQPMARSNDSEAELLRAEVRKYVDVSLSTPMARCAPAPAPRAQTTQRHRGRLQNRAIFSGDPRLF